MRSNTPPDSPSKERLCLEKVQDLAQRVNEALTCLNLSVGTITMVVNSREIREGVDLLALLEEHRRVLKDQTDILIELNREILLKTNGNDASRRPMDK